MSYSSLIETIDVIDKTSITTSTTTATPLTLIGKGGFGKVYREFYPLDNRVYALKKILLTRNNATTALREVRVLSGLDHPHIVRYYHSWLETFSSNIECTSSTDSISSIASSSCSEADAEEDEAEAVVDTVAPTALTRFFLCIRMQFCESTLYRYMREETNRSFFRK